MDSFTAASNGLYTAIMDIATIEAQRSVDLATNTGSLVGDSGITVMPIFQCHLDVVAGMAASTPTSDGNAIDYQLVIELGGGVLAFALSKDSLKLAAKLAESVLTGLSSSSPSVDILKNTSVLLCMAPMRYSVWNMRKRALIDAISQQQGRVAPLPSKEGRGVFLQLALYELTFLNLIQSKHPKVPETWSHRAWVIRWISANITSREVVLRAALSLGSMRTSIMRSADKHPRNYPQWSGYMHPIANILLPTRSMPCGVAVVPPPLLMMEALLEYLECVVSSYGSTHPRDVSFYLWVTSVIVQLRDTTAAEVRRTHTQEDELQSINGFNAKLCKLAFRVYIQHTRQLLSILTAIEDESIVVSQDACCGVRKQVVGDGEGGHQRQLYLSMVRQGQSRVLPDGQHTLYQGMLTIRKATIKTLLHCLPHSSSLLPFWELVMGFELPLIQEMLDGAVSIPQRSPDHAAMVVEYNQFVIKGILYDQQVSMNQCE